MPRLKKLLPFLLLLVITGFFFRDSLIAKKVPFPGDLLVAEYQPFRSYAYLGYQPGGIPNKGQYFDSIREFYPWRRLVTDQIKKATLPVWNPYNSAGTPLLANYQSAVFYPLNLIYLLFSLPVAWTITVMLQPLLAAFFTYLYARAVKISRTGSLLAALAFAYSSYLTVWLEFNTVGQTLLWLPLVLFALEKWQQSRRKLFLFLLASSLLCSLFAGHPLDFFVVFIFVFFYAALLQRQFSSLPVLGLVLLIGLVQLIPTWQFLGHSTRAFFNYDFIINSLLLQPYQLIMLLIPDFFGHPASRNFWLSNSYVGLTLSFGIVPFIFAVHFLLSKKKSRLGKFFIFSGLLVLLVNLKSPLTELIYHWQIPIISTNSPTKLFSLLVFAGSLLAGFGFDAYRQLSPTKIKNILKTAIVCFAIILVALAMSRFLPAKSTLTALKQSLYTGGVIAAVFGLLSLPFLFRKANVRVWIFAGVILLTIFDLNRSFSKFNPFVPSDFIFPENPVITFLKDNAGINRYWGYGTAKIDANIATFYGIYSPDGFDALNVSWYNQFINASKNGRLRLEFNQENRSTTEIAPGYGEMDLPENFYRLRILDLLGVRYVLDRTENPQNAKTFPTDRFNLVYANDQGWRIYENKLSLPRFFLSRDVQPYATPEEFEKLFFAANFNPAKTLLLTTTDYAKVATELTTVTPSEDSLEVLEYQPSRLIFRVKNDQPAVFFLSDVYYPNWRATVDNQPSEIFRADYAFRAVFVPAGEHRLVFRYQAL